MKTTLRTAIAVAAIVVGNTSSADTIRIGGTGVALGGISKLASAFEGMHPGTQVTVLPSLGSSGGVKALLAGAIDLGVTSRELKDSEHEAGATARPYAITPLAVVTSLGTTADGVTTQDLEAIYEGKLTHWPDGSVIRVVMRPASESDTQLLKGLSTAMAAAVDIALERPGLVSATNDQENAETLEELPGSIGLVALGQIRAENRKLKILSLNGERPRLLQNADLDASFAKSLYLVSKPDMTSEAQDFVQFIYSDAGRTILSALDHAPVE